MDSIEGLRLKVSQLEEDLEDAQKNLYKAAECGNTLLGTNQLLNDKLEAREKEYAARLEELEQDNFSLKMKLECQQTTTSSLQQELEATLALVESEQITQEKRLTELHSRKVSELTVHNDDLKAEIAKLNVQVKTFQGKVKKQEEIIEQLREEASSRCDASMLHNELLDLERLYAEEKARCEGLELELMEDRGQLELSTMEISALQQKTVGLEEECEEKSKMAKEWYDALQASKDCNAELASQLELLKRQDNGGGEHTKTAGNSLFGEVDDRRMNVERKMISLKVKYESMERTHNTTKQQLRKMKAEMSALLCQYSATTADTAHVQRLQRALSQSKSEVQVMAAKVHRMEQQQAEGVALQDVKKYMSAFVDLGDKAEYIHFLEQKLEQQKTSHLSVIKELDLKRTQLLWETNKLSETETKLYQSQQELAKLRKDQSKLRMRNQETLEKLEQAQISSRQLEADKKYLEEELKGGKRRKSSAPSQSTCAKEDLTSEPGAAVPIARPSLCSQPHRVINILEDLDKENFFNPKDSRGEKHTVSLNKKSERLHEDRDVEERCPEGERSRERSKVIYVNSKDNVNKCPQQ